MKVFLDNNAVSTLVSRHYRDAGSSLIAKAIAGRIEVVSSLPLLQEVMRTHDVHGERYRRMRNFLFSVTRHCWLWPLNERADREAVAGGPLVGPGRFLGPTRIAELERISMDAAGLSRINEVTHRDGNQYKKDHERAKTHVLDEVRKRYPNEKPGQIVRKWWRRRARRVDSFTRRILRDEDPRPAPRSVPSVWHFVAYRLALVVQHLSEGHAAKASDYYDAEHYSAASYADILVTDDTGFRRTVSQCPLERPARVQGLRGFLTGL